MFNKVLIANRGEIACRIIKTLKKLNITAVAVYSEADQCAEHVKAADEAYCLGGAAPHESYLNIAKIISVAKQAGVEAIHPGYGFLSENAAFAQACVDANIVFIGPPVAAIAAMGSKAAAKALMAEHEVPILSGYHGDNQDEAFLLKQAEQIDFPILIKASAGGGGRGMRIVHDAKHFKEELAAAKREALSGFGNDHVILEKYLVAPRHVEVQIFADQQQNYVYLFERDCSVQRRNQKVVEEAPAPGISEETRRALGEAAIKAAAAVGYVGAGTVEFLMDKDQQFYFMEMNTRLQVEHPVTEMITGQDLVWWQLQVAAGQTLPKRQIELELLGAAMEVRVCAEDPLNNFLPATGKITCFKYPAKQPQLRMDTGFTVNSEVSIYYDSLLGKLIAFGENREAARRNLAKALSQTAIEGVKTNLALLHRIVTHPDFVVGQISTHFITQHEHALLNEVTVLPGVIVAAAVLHQMVSQLQQSPQDPWHSLTLWSNNQRYTALQFKYGAFSYRVEAKHVDGIWQLTIRVDEQSPRICRAKLIMMQNHIMDVMFEGETWNLSIINAGMHYTIGLGENRYALEMLPRFGYADQGVDADSQLVAPMPGRIVSQMVCEGDEVAEGQTLMVMEAMKMEHSIRAPYAGKVAALYCQVGDVVSEGKKLVDVM